MGENTKTRYCNGCAHLYIQKGGKHLHFCGLYRIELIYAKQTTNISMPWNKKCIFFTTNKIASINFPPTKQVEQQEDIFYKKLTKCTCDDNPYTFACDFCLARRGCNGYFTPNNLRDILNKNK